jgi:hypothetical protein
MLKELGFSLKLLLTITAGGRMRLLSLLPHRFPRTIDDLDCRYCARADDGRQQSFRSLARHHFGSGASACTINCRSATAFNSDWQCSTR